MKIKPYYYKHVLFEHCQANVRTPKLLPLLTHRFLVRLGRAVDWEVRAIGYYLLGKCDKHPKYILYFRLWRENSYDSSGSPELMQAREDWVRTRTFQITKRILNATQIWWYHSRLGKFYDYYEGLF